MSHEENDSKLIQDLEQRIDTLEELDDAEFGSFTRMDYVILVIGALIIPALVLILAR